jgi:hypothetical protein
MKVEFKNVDGSLLKARIKFFPYKQFILNSLLMVVCDLNVEGCKIRIDTERDVIGMEVCFCKCLKFYRTHVTLLQNMVKPTDVWNKFEICNLQRLRAVSKLYTLFQLIEFSWL